MKRQIRLQDLENDVATTQLHRARLRVCTAVFLVATMSGGCPPIDLPQLNPANVVPRADAGPDLTVAVGQVVTLDASGSSDADGDALSYAWSQTYGPSVALSDELSMRPHFTVSEVGAHEFSVTVADGRGGTDADVVRINALAASTDGGPLYTFTIEVQGQGAVAYDPMHPGNNPPGTRVTITPRPASGWHFDHWEGAISGDAVPAVFILNSDVTIIAVFVEIPPPPPPQSYNLQTWVSGQGTLTLDPPGGTYTPGAEVILTASPANGWHIDRWSPSQPGDPNSITVTMDANKSVGVVFKQSPPQLRHFVVPSLSHPSGGTLTMSPAATESLYLPGDTVTIHFTNSPGYAFDHWEGDISSTDNPLVVQVDSCKRLTAVLRYWGLSAGPTSVSGGLYSDTVWTASTSPYVVTQDVVVTSQATLTIEPGVEVRFAPGTGLVVRGRLHAVGTSLEPVIITADGAATKGAWRGITFEPAHNPTALVQNARISCAEAAVYQACCWTSTPLVFRNTEFSNNTAAFAGNSDLGANSANIIDCRFTDNTKAIDDGQKCLYRCTFDLNQYGLYYASRMQVYGCVFTNNDTAMHGSSGQFAFCTIAANAIGLSSYRSYYPLHRCSVQNNGIGLDIERGDEPVRESNIFGNSTANVRLSSSLDADMTDNWWGTIDQAAIESAIIDGRDDPAFGLVLYYPFRSAPVDIAVGRYLEVETMGHGVSDQAIAAFDPSATTRFGAFPDPGYYFSHWELDASGTNSPIDVVMDTDKRIRAVFLPNP